MEVRIGVQNAAREVVLESAQSAAEVGTAVAAALEDGSVLRLQDERGRTVLVSGSVIAYVEVGAEEARKVGFGVRG